MFASRKWILPIMSIILWVFGLSGIILNYSGASDFNYYKGELLDAKHREFDVKNRFGGKSGTAHEVKFVLKNSKPIFYIDNNFAKKQGMYLKEIKEAKIIEVWADGDLHDGIKQRVYQLKVDGRMILDLESTKSVYIDKSHLTLYFAFCFSLASLFFLRPRWWLNLIRDPEEVEDDSLLDFYLGKFETRDGSELENIIENPSDFHPDAVTASIQTLENRKGK